METFNVVIADDHPIVLLGVRELVERDRRFNVVGEAVCPDGLIELLKSQAVDLLITDFNMPNMNGAELIQKVRAIDSYSYLPILLLTTEVRQEKIQQAIDGNITAIVKKPFDTAEFVKIVKKALR